MEKSIVQLTLIQKPFMTHLEHNYIQNDNPNKYYYINLGKIFWNELFSNKLYKTFRKIDKLKIKLLCKKTEKKWSEDDYKKLKNLVGEKNKLALDKRSLNEYLTKLNIFLRKWSKYLKIELSWAASFYDIDGSYKKVKEIVNYNTLIYKWFEIKIDELVLKYKPKIICMEINNTTDFVHAIVISRYIKKKYNVKIFIHRHWFEYFHLTDIIMERKEILKYLLTNIDYIVISNDYDENYIMDQLTRFIDMNDYGKVIRIDGLCGTYKNEIFINNNLTKKNMLNEIKIYDDKTRDYQYYEDWTIATIKNEKCSWSKCNFCTHNSKFQTNREKIYKFESLLNLHKKHHYKIFLFNDEASTIEEILNLIDFIKLEKLSIYWGIRCSVMKEFSNNKLLKELYKHGCREIVFGQESFNSKILKKMNKRHKDMDKSECINIYDNIIQNNISVFINMIFFYPEQQFGDIKYDLDILVELRKKYSKKIWFNFNTFNFMYGSNCYKKMKKSDKELYIDDENYIINKGIGNVLNEYTTYEKEYIYDKYLKITNLANEEAIDKTNMYIYHGLISSSFSSKNNCNFGKGRENIFRFN